MIIIADWQEPNLIAHSENLRPVLYIKFENETEFNTYEKIPELEFLGDTYTPIKTNTMQDLTGADGSLFNFSTIDKNTVTLKFLLHYRDYYHYKALRHQVYDLLMQKCVYRIRTDAEPFMIKYCYSTGFEIEPTKAGSNGALVTLTMDNPSGYLFSMYPSNMQQDIWDNYPLGWHVPVFAENDFTFTNNHFQVFNPSSKEIDPYYDKDNLKFSLNFAGKTCKLTNKTNGSTYTYNKASNEDDDILVDGITTYVNNTVATANTSYDNLVLARGWNDIQVSGATSINITFSFPFVYL